MRSQLEPMKRVARMIKSHLASILTYLTHRVTNAVTEWLNAKIQWVKHSARGYRNPDAFKTAILFNCGGLDLGPRIGGALPTANPEEPRSTAVCGAGEAPDERSKSPPHQSPADDRSGDESPARDRRRGCTGRASSRIRGKQAEDQSETRST